MRRDKHKRESDRKKKIHIAIANFVFLVATLFTIFGFCIAIAIRGQEDESIIENRALNKFPAFSLGDFFNGSYQDNLEKSLTDQMVMGQSIKDITNTKKSELTSDLQLKIAALFDSEETQTTQQEQQSEQPEEKKPRNIKYIPISNNVYYYGNSDYMVFKYRNVEKYKDEIDEMAEVYNARFPNTENYFYMVTNSKAINFNTVDDTENEFLTYVKQVFNFKCAGLKINSYEQYKDYFYKTDHHWNYKGSYQGYKDIINLLLPGEEVLTPTGTTVYDVNYYGSNARTTSVYKAKEKFTVYDYELPEYKTYINGTRARYDNHQMYEEGDYSTEKGYNHYAAYYGGDYAEVIYDFSQPEKDNLLVIAPSYSNPINNLIASHFNKTYFIDLRHYKNEFGKEFNPEEYCKEHKIDKFLLMISIDHLTNGNFMLEK